MPFRNRISKKVLLLITGDIAFLYAALYSGLWIRYAPTQQFFAFWDGIWPFSLVFAAWIFLFGSFGLYDLRFLKNSKMFTYRLLRAMGINTGVAIIIFYLLPLEIEPRRNLFIIVAAATCYLFLWRFLFNHVIVRTPPSRVVFVGFNREMAALADVLLYHPQLGHRPVAFLKNGGGEAPLLSSLPVFSLKDKSMAAVVREVRADTIVIAREMKQDKHLIRGLLRIIPAGIAVTEFPAYHEMLTGKIPLSLIEEVWFLENLIGMKKPSYEFTKRIFDMLLAMLLAIPAALAYPFIALAIKLDSEGPVLYRQLRMGRHGKPFGLIKYRSMVQGADKMSGFKDNGGLDPRLTRVGMFLRKRYLDEIPQIMNIFRGDMSFIGPRPERPEYVEEFKIKTPFYETRLLVPPGLTGWAQINMENDASVEDAPEKMQYDLYYIKNRSFVLDLLIGLRTIFTILQRQGR